MSSRISPSDNDSLFWGIEADTNGTEVRNLPPFLADLPVVLKETCEKVVLTEPTDPHLHKNWNIHRAPLVVEHVVDGTHIEIEWIDTR